MCISYCTVSAQNKRITVVRNGLLIVEAEAYASQAADEVRKWYIISDSSPVNVQPDGDESHATSASNKAYIEILPDTRRTDKDKLIAGENYSNNPGMAVLTYHIKFKRAGRYYIWVKTFSTGNEDNSIHVGLNNQWPESGQRMQWCEGKNSWTWASKQRTEKNHCGEPGKIYLDVTKKGVNVIQFSMREDGFEIDQFIVTNNRDFRPMGYIEPVVSP
ncbi:MAG: hypothetical protein H7Y07_10475 [Pyrinomonadaceae bacterium]|nr:hypothetical protein [Sphingobacteriaceae bacterium]